MTEPFVLSPENYYSKDRPHLSASDIKCYLRSPEEFYHRKILKDLESSKPSPAMKRGSIFDELITEGKTNYKAKVTKEQDAEAFAWQKLHPELVVSPDDMEEAVQTAAYLVKSKHLDFDNGIMQDILEATSGVHKLCGKPDYYKVDEVNKTIDLLDLKFSNAFTAKDANSWLRHAKDFGYDIQLKMYSLLLKKKYGMDYTVRCRNLVMVYNSPYNIDIYNYLWPDTLLIEAASKIKMALSGIEQGIFESTPTVKCEELVDPSVRV